MTFGGARNASGIDGIFTLGLGVKKQPSLQDRRLKNKPTGIRIDAVDAPVDCYFPFHFVLNPLVLVGHVTDTCEPQAFML